MCEQASTIKYTLVMKPFLQKSFGQKLNPLVDIESIRRTFDPNNAIGLQQITCTNSEIVQSVFVLNKCLYPVGVRRRPIVHHMDNLGVSIRGEEINSYIRVGC